MKTLYTLAAAFFCVTITPAIAGLWEQTEDFESSNPAKTGWFAGPGAGFDYEKNLAHTGKGNAWVRNLSGWSAVNTWITVPQAKPGFLCTAQAWIRMSDGVTDGYFSVRGGDGKNSGPVIAEKKLVGPNQPNPSNANYNLITFQFPSNNGQPMLFYVGNWGNGKDNWIQIDDFAVACQTPYPQ
jgi:hypothetical protein